MIDINLKHILCPVDFSECSRQAFDQAVAIARRHGADLTVLHVLPVPSAVPALPYGPEGPGPFGFETVTRGRALAELKRFLATEDGVGVPVHYETVEASNVYKEILQQASVTAADLVVMGTHGRSGFDYLVLGSVAEKTLRTSPAPVLIVPPLNPEGLPADRGPVRSVLCAVDFSQDSALALEYAVSIVRHAAGRLTLLHVVEPISLGYDPKGGTGLDVEGYERGLAESGLAQLQKFAPDGRGARMRGRGDRLARQGLPGDSPRRDRTAGRPDRARRPWPARARSPGIRLDGRAPRQAIDVPGPRRPAAGILMSGSDPCLTRV